MTSSPRIREAVFALGAQTGREASSARLLPRTDTVKLTTPQGLVAYHHPNLPIYVSPVANVRLTPTHGVR